MVILNQDWNETKNKKLTNKEMIAGILSYITIASVIAFAYTSW